MSSNVNGYGKNGAICGTITGGNVEQAYVKNDVNITLLFSSSSNLEIGGLFGFVYPIAQPFQLVINNSYSLANVNAQRLNSEIGGMIGSICLANSFDVKIINSYSNVFLFSANTGNIVGNITNCVGQLSFNNTFFNNENGFPMIKATNGCNVIGSATGLNSSELLNAIINNFPPSIWCGRFLCNRIIIFFLILIYFLNFFWAFRE